LSENGSTFAVRDTAKGSKNRTIAGAIKALFRKTAQLVSGRDDDEPRPQTRRRGRGETEGDLRKPMLRPSRAAARGRYAALQPVKAEQAAAVESAGLYLADTLAWLQLWEDNAAHEQWLDDSFSSKQDRYSPQP
jgi:hypothetical protein